MQLDPDRFEKLGTFYLGQLLDPDGTTVRPEPLLYDAKDLTTHGLCVGMTGSGKTGLCLALLEEAAIDGIPAIAIDPKGDLANLMLSFPKLRAEDFLPWVDEGQATRAGQTTAEYARTLAKRWRKGLADTGQDPSRIARLRENAQLQLFTPGYSAGRPLSALRSLAAPPPALASDADALRERVTGAVSGLLALLGMDADPIQSREHILLSTLLQQAWSNGQSLDLAGLISGLLTPPIERIGVMDLDTFFPAKARQQLAMSLNNLLAAPAFAAWTEGEALDIGSLLWTPSGKPCVSILSLAHLSDTERMFFVTLLLGEVVAWMRTQPGTSSLRALLYMDEVFGFFPPVAEPPSKKPMLTLLKQGRAHGLGVLLATQNPVDLDYKGLGNCGTWWLGKLQTERDIGRVLEGLEGAAHAAGQPFDAGATAALLAGLRSRAFLMHNVHDAEPALFRTRFTLSYLRGPLTRDQLGRLASEQPAPERDQDGAARAFAAAPAGASPPPQAPAATPAPGRSPAAGSPPDSAPATIPGAMMATVTAATTAPAALVATTRTAATTARPAAGLSSAAKATTLRSVAQPPLTPDPVAATAPQPKPVRAAAARPSLPEDVEELFLASPLEGRLLEYRPALLARVVLHYVHNHADLDAWLEPTLLCPLPRGRGKVTWGAATWTQWESLHTMAQPASGARFAPPPASRVTAKGFSSMGRSLRSHLAREESMPVWYCRPQRLWSSYGESRAEFTARAQHGAREKRDRAMEKLRTQYAPKLARLRERIRKSEHRASRQQAESTQQKYQTAVTVGATALGALFGRRSVIGGAASTARGVGRIAMEHGDVRRAQENVVVDKQRLLDLEQELEASLGAIAEQPTEAPIEQKDVRPRKGDIEVVRQGLVWMPWRIDRAGDGEPGWSS